jgi:hypothetical protein
MSKTNVGMIGDHFAGAKAHDPGFRQLARSGFWPSSSKLFQVVGGHLIACAVMA